MAVDLIALTPISAWGERDLWDALVHAADQRNTPLTVDRAIAFGIGNIYYLNGVL